MGTHMLMTIGGLVLFATFLVSANGLIADNARMADENEYFLTALGLAQSVLEEAKSKAFDELTVTTPAPSRSGLTAFGSLGRESGEVIPLPDSGASGYLSAIRFDDIDDYDGYERVVRTPRADGYRVRVRVTYVSESDPDAARTFPTYCKRMTITVLSPYLPGPFSFAYAFAY